MGESGTAKSPAQELAVEPLRALDDAARREHAKAMADFEAEKLKYERDLAAWKKGKGGSSPPEKPKKPKCERVVAADATIEAVAHLLNDSGRGSLTIARDELAAWFKGWGEYRSAGSSESSKWLELYGARALTVDRATKDPIHVSRAAVSVIGGTQPGVLRRVLTPEHLESGCAARILFAWPPRRPRRWSDRDIEEATAERYEIVVKRLGALRPTTFTQEGGDVVATLGLHQAVGRQLVEPGVEDLLRPAPD